MSNPILPPDHNSPSRQTDSTAPTGGHKLATAAGSLRPEPDEGSLAWGYLAAVAAIFVGLVIFAWSCNDRDKEVGGAAESSVAVSNFQPAPTDNTTTTLPPTTATSDPDATEDTPSTTAKPEEPEVSTEEVQKSISDALLENPITFEPGEAEFASGEGVLEGIATSLKTVDTKILVEGHTDSIGDAEENLTLSQERADAVLAELSGKYEISEDRMTAEGFGEKEADQSVKPSEEQKTKDRKIKITLVTE